MGTSARRAQDGARARASRAAGPSLSSQPRPVRPPLPAPRERRSSGLLRDDGCRKEERGLWQRRGKEDGAPHGLRALAAEGALARLVPTRAPGSPPPWAPDSYGFPSRGKRGQQSNPIPFLPSLLICFRPKLTSTYSFPVFSAHPLLHSHLKANIHC